MELAAATALEGGGAAGGVAVEAGTDAAVASAEAAVIALLDAGVMPAPGGSPRVQEAPHRRLAAYRRDAIRFRGTERTLRSEAGWRRRRRRDEVLGSKTRR